MNFVTAMPTIMVDSTKHVPTAMSTSALENKLKDLRAKSNKHSQILTAKLASSQSGKNLLHIGASLSTLPPDLHSLLTQLHPVLSCTETVEKEYLQRLQKLVKCGNEIRFEERRVFNARECAGMYEDLLAAENTVRKDSSQRRAKFFSWKTPMVDNETDGVFSCDRVSCLGMYYGHRDRFALRIYFFPQRLVLRTMFFFVSS